MMPATVDDYLRCLEGEIESILCKPVFINALESDSAPDQEDHYHDDIDRIRCQHFDKLLRLLSKETEEEILCRINRLISNLCGQGSCGPLSRKWTLKTAAAEDITLQINEPEYASAGLGWKTWGGSILLAQMLISEIEFIRTMPPTVAVELGCGTALAGMVLDKLLRTDNQTTSIYLTDYQDSVLRNAQLNIERNKTNKASVRRLDWFDERGLCDNWPRQGCDFVMAADVIYDNEQASAVPKVIDYLLSNGGTCWIVSPQRPQYCAEIHLFEQEMLKYFENTRTKRIWQRDIHSQEVTSSSPEDEDPMCRNGVWYTFNEYRRTRGADDICIYSNMM